MTECVDTDELVSLSTALQWDVEPRLQHIVSCDACRERLRALRSVRNIVAQEVMPREGFADAVVDMLPRASVSGRMLPGWLVGVLNMSLASLTAIFAFALVGSDDMGLQMGTPVVLIAGIVGVVTVAWNAARPVGGEMSVVHPQR